jgi:hypothetical protein
MGKSEQIRNARASTLRDDKGPYDETVAVLASMHGKERVIGPLLHRGLGLVVRPAIGLDTDRFGTFSRDIERRLSPLAAARAKIEAAFAGAPDAQVGIASEGSFGPHPVVPFLPFGRELVLLIDRWTGFELTGHEATPKTNFGHAVVRTVAEATEFAAHAGFPDHGVIVAGCIDEEPAPSLALQKDIADHSALEAAVRRVVAICGAAWVETDMRANRNPLRMMAIERATRDLVRRFLSRCPACAGRGFDVSGHEPGLPCADCGEPTGVTRCEILLCEVCGYREERPVGLSHLADPSQCSQCNP